MRTILIYQTERCDRTPPVLSQLLHCQSVSDTKESPVQSGHVGLPFIGQHLSTILSDECRLTRSIATRRLRSFDE